MNNHFDPLLALPLFLSLCLQWLSQNYYGTEVMNPQYIEHLEDLSVETSGVFKYFYSL